MQVPLCFFWGGHEAGSSLLSETAQAHLGLGHAPGPGRARGHVWPSPVRAHELGLVRDAHGRGLVHGQCPGPGQVRGRDHGQVPDRVRGKGPDGVLAYGHDPGHGHGNGHVLGPCQITHLSQHEAPIVRVSPAEEVASIERLGF